MNPLTDTAVDRGPDAADKLLCPACGFANTAMLGKFSTVCGSCLFGLALGAPVAEIQGDYVIEPILDTTRLFGSYVALEEIGRGGMGVIYRAIHHDTGEIVALKTVRSEYAGCAETRTRFGREAEAASSLDHPNVMPIYEVGVGDFGVPFFCMKLAEHGSLHELGGKYRGRWHQIAELMIKIAEAVEHAHAHGVLHRDLKPGNILFDEDLEPLVTDFGLAKRLTTTEILTHSCSVLGTPSYIAPEQAAGKTKEITRSADIYGLGAIFYELLTGRPPFLGDNPLDVLRQVAEHALKRPCRLIPAVPKPLEAICLRCLRRAPRDRYASARDLANDLSLWIQGRSIQTPTGCSLLVKVCVARLADWKRAATILTLTLLLGIGWHEICAPPPPTSPVREIAVMIEDWGEGIPLADLALKSSAAFKRSLAQNKFCRVVSGATAYPPSLDTTFDPIAYGRANKTQVVLSGCLRRSGNEIRLIARLVNCDTGKVVWHRTKSFPSNRADKVLPAMVESLANEIKSKWRADPQALLQPLERVPVPEAQRLYVRAMELVARQNRHDLDTAVTLMRQAVRADPTFGLASGMLAFALWTQADVFGETEQLPLALETARQTLLIDPNSTQAHRVIAACLQNTARHCEAIEEFWAALEIDAQSVGCYQSLAISLREMGQPHRSVRWLKRAINFDPSRGAYYSSLAESLAICGDDQEAEAAFAHRIALDGVQPELQIDLGVMRLWQGRFDEAKGFCSKARAQMPDCRYGRSLAAWIELCAENHKAAKTDYEVLRSGNSYRQDWEFYGAVNPSSALAFLAMKAGMKDRAQSLCAEALDIDQQLLVKYPKNARVLHDLAATCAVAGQNDQSRKYLQEAISAGWAEFRSTRIDPRFSGVAALPWFEKSISKNSDAIL